MPRGITNDTLKGGVGKDLPSGEVEADRFILDQMTSFATMGDFVSGMDHLCINDSAPGAGMGDGGCDRSSNANGALVLADEWTQLAILTGNAAVSPGDYAFLS
ncbi:hypothetical protein HSX11_28510 [Oxalobacteraceae bacterium]|nr:hypothetical protein [Oxalobacteraceae bacterium]